MNSASMMPEEMGGGQNVSDNHRRSPEQDNGLHCTRAVPYMLTSFGQYAEGFGTLRAAGGDIGGGSEVLIVQHILAESSGDTNAQTCHLVYE